MRGGTPVLMIRSLPFTATIAFSQLSQISLPLPGSVPM
jgi:hypothetical protein